MVRVLNILSLLWWSTNAWALPPIAASEVEPHCITDARALNRRRTFAETSPSRSRKQLVDEVERLEAEVWPEGTRASRDKFENRLDRFPEGFIPKRDPETGEILGLTTSMIVKLDSLDEIKTWEQITSYGTISNHDAQGDTMYIVSVGVSPRARGRGIGQDLVKEQIELARRMGLKRVVLGSRIPSLHKHPGDPLEYVNTTDEKGFSVEPEIRFYQKSGLRVHSVKPNYMEDDWESRNYGAVMVYDLR